MITRALIGRSPTGALRRAAYVEALGAGRVGWLTDAPDLGGHVVVDLDDPDDPPADLRDRLAASDALIVAGAPGDMGARGADGGGLAGPGGRPGCRGYGGPCVARTALHVQSHRSDGDAPRLGPPAWRAVLALAALGGGLRRVAARRQPRGAGVTAVYGVGRFCDGSIAYVEAAAQAPPGSDVRIYEAVGRGGIREYDSRRSINRVIRDGAVSGLPAQRIHPYAQFVRELCRASEPGAPAERAPVLAAASAAYAALLRACESDTAVRL